MQSLKWVVNQLVAQNRCCVFVRKCTSVPLLFVFISPFHVKLALPTWSKRMQTLTRESERARKKRETHKIYMGYVCDYANNQSFSSLTLSVAVKFSQSLVLSIPICRIGHSNKRRKSENNNNNKISVQFCLNLNIFLFIFSLLIKLIYHQAPYKRTNVVIYHLQWTTFKNQLILWHGYI